MTKDLERVESFLDQHHVMSLATTDFKDLNVCSLFYAYSSEYNFFFVASSETTRNIQDIKQNQNISGNILLETKTVGKIQGVPFWGEFTLLQNDTLKKLYFKTFPYALALLPTLWKIDISKFKMTDNKLGFGKKIIWERK